jgi:membrane-associated phospholipid phosphatase
MVMETLVRILADGAMIPIVLLAGYALLFLVPKGQHFEAYSRILMAGLTAFLIAKLLGTIYQPATERPFELLGLEAGASYLNNPGFPSDHALFATFLALAVWFETRARKIALVIMGLTILVCLGRVLALVHTPLDVAGGIIVATAGALWYLQADKKPVLHQPLAKKTKI